MHRFRCKAKVARRDADAEERNVGRIYGAAQSPAIQVNGSLPGGAAPWCSWFCG